MIFENSKYQYVHDFWHFRELKKPPISLGFLRISTGNVIPQILTISKISKFLFFCFRWARQLWLAITFELLVRRPGDFTGNHTNRSRVTGAIFKVKELRVQELHQLGHFSKKITGDSHLCISKQYVVLCSFAWALVEPLSEYLIFWMNNIECLLRLNL